MKLHDSSGVWFLAFVLLFILFAGEPDLHDSLMSHLTGLPIEQFIVQDTTE